MTDLHPYDGTERRFRHTDASRTDGLAVVARLLGLPESLADEVLYDLSFYSGGIGVYDQLAISIPADPNTWLQAVEASSARTLDEAEADAAWVGELLWLFTREEQVAPLRAAAVAFINGERRDFQGECLPSNRIAFSTGSDVNHWVALWGDDTRLNYRGFDQG